MVKVLLFAVGLLFNGCAATVNHRSVSPEPIDTLVVYAKSGVSSFPYRRYTDRRPGSLTFNGRIYVDTDRGRTDQRVWRVSDVDSIVRRPQRAP